MQKTVETVV